MSKAEGLSLLGDLENMQQIDVELKEDELRWGAGRWPQVPHSVWKYMRGQGECWREVSSSTSLPWNRHRRRKLWRSRGVILHLFSGKNYKPWCELEQAGYTVLATASTCMTLLSGPSCGSSRVLGR